MNTGDGSAQGSPSTLIHGERHNFLAVCDKMGAENRAYVCRGTGTLKLDRTVNSVGIGAGQGTEATLRRRPGEYLGIGDPDTKGEVGVNVEVSKHL
jgi:hypothetical protein